MPVTPAPDKGHTLVIVATVPGELAWPSGEPAAKLHCTLSYLGDGFDDVDALAVCDVATRVAQSFAPMEATVGGVGTLGTDGALVAYINADGLTDLHNALVSELSSLFGRDMSGNHDGFIPHVTLAYRRTPSGEELTKMTDFYHGQTFPLAAVAVWDQNEPLATIPLGPPVTSLVRDLSLLPVSYLGTWEIDLLRIGQSTGMRRFEMNAGSDDHQYWRALPLPLQATTQTTVGHNGADNAGAVAEISLDEDNVLRARGWFSADDMGYRIMRKVMAGEITGQSVDLDEDIQVREVPADNAYGFERVYDRWRILGATITPHPALPSAGVMRVMVNPDYEDATSYHQGPLVVPGAAGREAAPDGMRAIDPELVRNEPLVAAGGISATPDIWVQAERRIRAHLAAGGSPDNIRQLFAGLEGDMVVDAPSRWFSNPELKVPTAPTFKDGRFYGHLALWGSCHRGLGVAVGRDGCVLAPHSPTHYSQFNIHPLPLADGQTIKVGKLTVGTGHADIALSADRSAAHYDNAGWAGGYVRVGEDKHGIWFSGIPSPFATDAQVWQLVTSQLSGDWRHIGHGLELIAALSVNVPGFSIPNVARVGFTTEGTAFSMLLSPHTTLTVPLPQPAALCACGANTECGCNSATPQLPEPLSSGCASCVAAEQQRLAAQAPDPYVVTGWAVSSDNSVPAVVSLGAVDTATGATTVRFGGAEFASVVELAAAIAHAFGLNHDDGRFYEPGTVRALQAAAQARQADDYFLSVLADKLGITDPLDDLQARILATATV